jgi:DNA-binding NarL/FixJ family response regulator
MSDAPSALTTIRVLLADDHDILRQGLKLLLGLQADMQVVGEARTGLEALELTREQAPDVVVMDISMAEMDGLEACRQIRSQLPAAQVLILTMHESEDYFLQALRAGAAGYLVKKAAPTELHMAIRAVAGGGVFLYPGLARALVRIYTAGVPPQAPAQPAELPDRARELQALTPREIEVLILVAQGHTNQEIADQLVLSIKTVQAHRASVMEKLELHDITHLVRFAIRHALIPAEP